MKKLTALLFLLLSLGAFAQAPQSTTTIAQPADTKYNNGIGNGYRVTKATGLTVNVGAGTVQCLDQWIDYAGGTKTVTDNAVSYIVLDPAQDCSPQVVSTLSQGTWWVAKVTASSGAVTAIAYAHMVPQISKVAITGAGGTGGGTNNQGTVALTGCGVNWASGLNFTVSPCTYLLAGTQYSSAQTDLTLTTADATNGRIDVIAVDSTGAAIVITGTPAGSPAEPSVDPATQLRLIAVSVPALATTPSGIAKTDLYLENTEYTCAVSSNLACASTSNPFAGTKDIEASSAVSGNNVTLTKPSGTLDLSSYSNLILYVRSKSAWANAKSLSIFWLNSSTVVGASVSVKTGNFGFSSSATGTYQQIVIPLGNFATGTNPVNQLKISVAGGGGSIGFYLDNVSIQSGVTSSGSGPQTFTVTPTSPLTGGGTAPVGGTVTVGCPTCGTGSGNVTGSSLTSGALIKGAGGVAIQTGDLTGDVTTSGATATTIANLAVTNAKIANSTIDLTTKVTGILPGANGGTENGFFKVAGPASSLKTLTFPNASATVLTDNALVTGAQGGTGNGFFAVTGPASSLKTFTFPNASANVLTDNAAVSIAQGGTGTGSTLTGLLRGSGSAFTGAELSGDVTTSGSNAVTVGKVNGIAYSATAAAHSVEVVTTANTTATPKAIPDCTDSGGNHLNFTQSTDAFSCGTSSPAATRGIPFTVGTPGGTALTAGASDVDYITVPFACTIAGYNLVIDTGTVTVKFWKKATGTAIPTSSDSISTAGVGISSGTAIHSSATSDFTTTTVTANDIMAMKVTAVSSAAYVQGVIPCTQ